MRLSIPKETRPVALAGIALAVILLWAFAPTLLGLAQRWHNDSRYTHGYLVPLFSGYLLWRKRDALAAAGLRPCWWGLPALLGARTLAALGGYLYLAALTALAFVACLP